MAFEFTYTDATGATHDAAYCRINAVEIRREVGQASTARIVADVHHDEAARMAGKPALTTLSAVTEFAESFDIIDGYAALKMQCPELASAYEV